MIKRSTTPAQIKRHATRGALLVLAVFMAVVAPFQFVQPARADEFDERIKALQGEIDQYQARAGELSQKANTLQVELDRLSNEKAALQKQIDLKQAEYDQTVTSIAENQTKIEKNQSVLGDTLASLYVDDKISTIEMLASSKSISEYVDKQEYRSAVRDQLTRTISDIKELKKKLEAQKKDAERILADQKNQRTVLASKEAEQQDLVSQTRGEEAAYQNLSADRTAKKAEVQRQQQAAIEAAMRRANAGAGGGRVSAGDPNKGGYPAYLANAPQDSIVDPWGMYNRECVSYTAWKVHQKTGAMPYWGGRGNANQWPGAARAAGVPTGSTPRAGSVGVIMAGAYGHVVWVESVNSNGTINISQYNYNVGGGWGQYSEMYNVSPNAYDVYIYF